MCDGWQTCDAYAGAECDGKNNGLHLPGEMTLSLKEATLSLMVQCYKPKEKGESNGNG